VGTQYVYTGESEAATITGYKINSDGSLSALSGSPFTALNGGVFMMVSAGTNLVADGQVGYSVNPATGAVTAGNSMFPGSRFNLVSDGSMTVYFVENIEPQHFPSLDAEHVSGGTLTRFLPSPGDPNIGPGVSWPLSMDPGGSFLYVARGPAQDVSGPLNLAVIPRNADGSLGQIVISSRPVCGTISPLSTEIGSAAFRKGNRTFLYFTCVNTDTLEYTVLDNSSGAVLSSGSVSNIPGMPTHVAAGSNAMAIDPSGSFLLMVDTAQATVDVYSLDPTSGAPGAKPLTQVATHNVPDSLVLDATGQFVYVVDTCAFTFRPNCSTASSIFGYRLDGGKMTPLPGSPYPAGSGSTAIAVVKP